MAYLDYEGLQHFKDKENEQIAPVENGNTSANAYEIGKYFWHEGNYCKAKTAIAVGDAFVQNTNYTVVKVGAEIEKKANTDGYYDAMTVGNAEQIVATVGVEDSTPYVFRKAGGGMAIGNREADTLVGGTIAWNQLQYDGNFEESTYWNGGTVANNKIALTSTAGNWQYGYNSQSVKLLENHKYLSFFKAKILSGMSSGASLVLLRAGATSSTYNAIIAITTTSAVENNTVVNASGVFVANSSMAATAGALFYGVYNSEASVSAEISKAMLFDLTQMFGTAIADQIYAMETATAGAGVAFFKSLFPKPYYAYNAGELMSVNTSAHVTTGFNQWDEEYLRGTWSASGFSTDATRVASKNKIKILPNTLYYFKVNDYSSWVNVVYYDIDENVVANTTIAGANSTFTTPSNAYYMNFNTSGLWSSSRDYNNDICINISCAKNGTYAPYEAPHTYPLDSSLTLRGVPRLGSNNKVYYDGDTYESDGTVTRRYSLLDMGNLTWNYSSSTACMYSSALPINFKIKANSICTKYISRTTRYDTTNDKYLTTSYEGWSTTAAPYLVVRDTSYTDATTFKTAMSGVYLVYELTTSTTETADPYVANQVVSGDGTEEYVDAGVQAETRDVSIPVGHNTVYQQDLRTKLQDAPDSPPADGDYIVRQTNGENQYVQLVIPQELPNTPGTDGTYRLQAAVSNGTATLSWVSAT